VPYGLAPRLKTKSRSLRKKAFVKVSTWKRGAKVGANIGPWRRDSGVQIDGHERSRALGGSLVQSLRLSRFISLFALLSFIPSFLPAAQGFPLHRLFRLQTRWVGIRGTSLFNFLFLLLNPFCLNSCCLLDLRLMCLFAFFFALLFFSCLLWWWRSSILLFPLPKRWFCFPVRWLRRGISFLSVTYFGVSFPFARHIAPGHGDL
jgi:hypothetical protein